MRGTKEFQEIIVAFERTLSGSYFCISHPAVRYDQHGRPVPGIPKDQYYEDGTTNELFKAYMAGYTLGKCVGRDET